MILEPLFDRVVVLPDDAPEKSPGGIILTDGAKEKPQQGIVYAVGPGKTFNGQLEPTSVKVGNRVLYGKFSGTELTHENVKYQMMRETDIIAILRPEEDLRFNSN